MKLILFILFLSFQVCYSQTSFSFTDIPATTDISGPGGSDQWNEADGTKIVTSVPPPWIQYRRVTWADCEDSNTPGDYTKIWFNEDLPGDVGRLRRKFMDAIDDGALFAFGVMQLYPGGCGESFSDMYTYDGDCGTYPEYVHDLMQASGIPDFSDGQNWIPSYNHSGYRARFSALWDNIRGWIDTASYNGVFFRDIIAYVDVRGFGSYGEWHHCCLGGGYDEIVNWPAGTFASVGTMKEIIDIQVDAMDEWPCVIIINSMDGERFQNTEVPAEVGIYALTKTNNFGKIGLRRDQVGDNSSYYHQILEDNTMSFGGVQANTQIMSRYQFAPFVGEPPSYQSGSTVRGGVHMGWAPSQVELLKMYSIGNGNYGNGDVAPTDAGADSMRRAFRLAGARIKLNGGSMTTTLTQSATFNVNIDFQNIGLTPEYRDWVPVLELRTAGGSVAWRDTMAFSLLHFQPAGSATNVSDNFTLPGAVATGTTYRLVLRMADPTGYMRDYPLATQGREETGAIGLYELRDNITVQVGSGNQSPVAMAGSNQTITLPTESVNVDGSASFDPDGTIVSYSWSYVSGPVTYNIVTPTTAATTINTLVEGIYVFRLIVTDDDPEGFTGFDDVQITVQPIGGGQPPLNNLIRAGRFKYKQTL